MTAVWARGMNILASILLSCLQLLKMIMSLTPACQARMSSTISTVFSPRRLTTCSAAYIPMPLALSEEEKAVQKEFKLIASGCIDLLVGAMRRTPAEKRRPLFLVFGELYPVFEFVRWTAEAGCAKWWMALQIIEKLEIVRKMVSSAFGGAPVDRSMVFARKVDLTGVDGEALAGHGLGSNLSVVIFVLMDSVFSNVKSDIDAMVSAASTPY
uniref:Uncharacterized protein n=1 Tax=Zea mays TaxID=4577 RepID=B6TA64_MAIZE|nr:hypothetical protein [Zea mays]